MIKNHTWNIACVLNFRCVAAKQKQSPGTIYNTLLKKKTFIHILSYKNITYVLNFRCVAANNLTETHQILYTTHYLKKTFINILSYKNITCVLNFRCVAANNLTETHQVIYTTRYLKKKQKHSYIFFLNSIQNINNKRFVFYSSEFIN